MRSANQRYNPTLFNYNFYTIRTLTILKWFVSNNNNKSYLQLFLCFSTNIINATKLAAALKMYKKICNNLSRIKTRQSFRTFFFCNGKQNRTVTRSNFYYYNIFYFFFKVKSSSFFVQAFWNLCNNVINHQRAAECSVILTIWNGAFFKTSTSAEFTYSVTTWFKQPKTSKAMLQRHPIDYRSLQQQDTMDFTPGRSTQAHRYAREAVVSPLWDLFWS